MVDIKTDPTELCYSLYAQFSFSGKLIITTDNLHEDLHAFLQSSRTEHVFMEEKTCFQPMS